MDKITIYYFTGTGNARYAAQWFSQVAGEKGWEASLVDISKLDDRKHINLPHDGLIGFSGPTHGFNYPPILLHFIFRFPRGNNRVFLMNTRAGVKLGPVFFPGLSGMAQYFSALVLMLKGYSVVGMKPVDLPSNWISLHPGLTEKAVQAIYQKRKPQVMSFAKTILSGKRNFRALFDLPWDLAITPIGILYYCIGRFFLAKTFYASRDCTHCNLCINSCPVNAIKEVAGHPYWTHACESCMKCMNTCPERAIETAHGFTALVVFLSYALIINRLYEWLDIISVIERQAGTIVSSMAAMGIETLIMFPLLYGGYHLVHYLMRFRLVERLMVWTSLTKLPFWNRYRAPKNQ